MKVLIKIQLLLFFMTTWGMAQVTITFDDMQLNGTTSIGQCATIDLKSEDYATITSTINLSRTGSSNTFGQEVLKVYHKKKTGGQSTLLTAYIPQSSWYWTGNTGTYDISGNVSLTASDVAITGDSLIAVFTTAGNSTYYSCKYPLKKDPPPTFSFATSRTIDCESPYHKTFTVNAQYATGATYEWNVGSGWANASGVPISGIVTTTSTSLQLKAHSYPYSNISVTPIHKSKRYPKMTCTINLSPFYSGSNIVGNTAICSGSSVYAMHNLQSNETVTWSVSDPAMASLSNATGNQVTLHKVGNGNVGLIGVVTNSCSQSNTKTITVGLGIPIVTKPNCGGGPVLSDPIGQLPIDNSACNLCRTYNFYSDKNLIEAEATGGGNLTWQWQKVTNNFGWTTNSNTAYFQPSQMGSVQFRVRAGNACGWSAWKDQQIMVSEECNSNTGNFRSVDNSDPKDVKVDAVNYFSLYPNPASGMIYLELVNRENVPSNEKVLFVELFDFYGNMKMKVPVDGYKARVDVSNLPKGIYIMKVNINGEIESHQVVVQ